MNDSEKDRLRTLALRDQSWAVIRYKRDIIMHIALYGIETDADANLAKSLCALVTADFFLQDAEQESL